MSQLEVQVRRKIEKTHLPTKIMNGSKRAVASVYKNKSPLGITDTNLEKRLLTDYLRIDDNDKEYGRARDEFWKNFRLIVPVEGVVLNISTRSSKDEDGKEIEIPNKIEDYITYLWLKEHPLVADSKMEMIRSPKKEFYIYDPIKESQKTNIQVKSKMQAYNELAKLSGNPEKANMLIRLLISGVNPESLNDEQRENHLSNFIESNPDKFVAMATDADLEIRSDIENMVDRGILRKQGSSYLYMDTTIGDSIAEAINFFKNDRNSELVLDLKSKLKDVM